MPEQPRDWERELADIDKVIASGGTPAPAGKPAPRAAGVPPSAAPVRASSGKAAVLGTWFRVVLAASLLSALVVWPFPKWCGGGLALFLASCGLGVITSLWATGASWSHRRGFAHVLGLLTLGGTLVLAGLEVLPRIGYAKEARTWLCAVQTPALPAATAPAPAVTPTSVPAAAGAPQTP